jgi:hypothetical protein
MDSRWFDAAASRATGTDHPGRGDGSVGEGILEKITCARQRLEQIQPGCTLPKR